MLVVAKYTGVQNGDANVKIRNYKYYAFTISLKSHRLLLRYKFTFSSSRLLDALSINGSSFILGFQRGCFSIILLIKTLITLHASGSSYPGLSNYVDGVKGGKVVRVLNPLSTTP